MSFQVQALQAVPVVQYVGVATVPQNLNVPGWPVHKLSVGVQQFQRAACPHYVPSVRMLPYCPSLPPLMPQIAHEVTEPQAVEGATSLKPWIDAARNFEMNTDFDLSRALCGRRVDLKNLMLVMKDESTCKQTIQALADKLMLHRMLENLGISQMPLRFVVEGHATRRQVEQFVLTELGETRSEEVVAKPTHLSNGEGVLILSSPQPHELEQTIETLTAHVHNCLNQQAGSHESAAMRSLRPGFIAQPRYSAGYGFDSPLELRVVVLWGKARLAIWWWGRGQGEKPSMNTWLVRRPLIPGALSAGDRWQAIHNHPGSSAKFDSALAVFERNISAIVSTAESIATACGAPFLRADFFVGCPKWGVRLNEVAYGCGCDYRNLADDFSGRIVDDAPSIAHILQEGMSQCCTRRPAEHFLSKLGVSALSYAHSAVPPQLLPPRPHRGNISEVSPQFTSFDHNRCSGLSPFPSSSFLSASTSYMTSKIVAIV